MRGLEERRQRLHAQPTGPATIIATVAVTIAVTVAAPRVRARGRRAGAHGVSGRGAVLSE